MSKRSLDDASGTFEPCCWSCPPAQRKREREREREIEKKMREKESERVRKK